MKALYIHTHIHTTVLSTSSLIYWQWVNYCIFPLCENISAGIKDSRLTDLNVGLAQSKLSPPQIVADTCISARKMHSQIYANLTHTHCVCVISAQRNHVHVAVFWIALFALLSFAILACWSSHSLWQRHVSPSLFSEPACQLRFLGPQLRRGGRGPRYPSSQQDLKRDLFCVSREQITLHACFLNSWINEYAAGLIIRACLSQVFY